MLSKSKLQTFFLDSTMKHSASSSCLASYAAVPEPKEPQAPRIPHDSATRADVFSKETTEIVELTINILKPLTCVLNKECIYGVHPRKCATCSLHTHVDYKRTSHSKLYIELCIINPRLLFQSIFYVTVYLTRPSIHTIAVNNALASILYHFSGWC
jgi:hypothetical protein